MPANVGLVAREKSLETWVGADSFGMTEFSKQCGPFDLVDKIGDGGLAEVWRGVHDEYDFEAAVKVVKKEVLDRGERPRKSFQREVQAIASLNHPGIVTVFSYGETDWPDHRAPYLAMELAGGKTLAERPIYSWSALRSVLRQILESLAYAHAREVIHRDLKPENVLFAAPEPDFECKLTDFGLAHAMSPEISSNTQNVLSVTGGTPYFMAPEQFRGEWRSFGPWTDLYALGCMTFRIVTGDYPFTAENVFGIATQHLEDALPPMSNPEFPVPVEFDEWLQTLTAKHIRNRFQKAADALRALENMSQPEPRRSAPSTERSREAQLDSGDTIATPPPSERDEDAGTGTLSELESTQLLGPGWSDPDAQTRPKAGASEKIDHSQRSDPVTGLSDADSWQHPTVPSDWREQRADSPTTPVLEGTLDLFSLREVPFSDRQRQRDRLWNDLRTVAKEGTPRACILEGRLGTGKSRLAEWLCRRADELGAANILWTTHSQKQGASGGLGRMLELFFTAWGLTRREVYDRIYERVGRLRAEAGHSIDKVVLQYEARALTEIIYPRRITDDDERTGFRFTNPDERYATFEQLLGHLVCRRPVILWFDNVQWGAEAVEITQKLLETDSGQSEGDLPILAMLTRDLDFAKEESAAAVRLEQLRSASRARTLEIGELDDTEQTELIHNTLPLESSTADQLRVRTGGNPLFTIQLLNECVERQLFEMTKQGFAFPTDEPVELPSSIYELWLDRVEDVVTGFENPYVDDIKRSLELGAALGRVIDADEWKRVCEYTDLDLGDDVVEELVRRGLAEPERDGWSFVHSLLRQALERQARQNDRWEHLNDVCAAVLDQMYPDPSYRVLERLATHLVAAGHPEDSLEPFLDAAREAMDDGDYTRARELLDRRRAQLDALEIDELDPRRIRGWRVEAKLRRNLGETEKAERLVDRILDAGQRAGAVSLGRATTLKGALACDRGDFEHGRTYYDKSIQYLEGGTEPRKLVEAHIGRSWALRNLGALDEAKEGLETALTLAKKHRYPSLAANAKRQLATSLEAEGHFERADQLTREALRDARQMGRPEFEAVCWNNMGEVARLKRDWDRAIKYYQNAAQLWKLSRHRNYHIARLNLAIVEIGAGDTSKSWSLLCELEERFEQIGYEFVLPIVSMAKLCCVARLGKWDSWDAIYADADKRLQQTGTVDKDLAWLAEETGDAASATEHSRAIQAYRLALYQRQQLGDETKQTRVREKIEALQKEQ